MSEGRVPTALKHTEIFSLLLLKTSSTDVGALAIHHYVTNLFRKEYE